MCGLVFCGEGFDPAQPKVLQAGKAGIRRTRDETVIHFRHRTVLGIWCDWVVQ